MRLPPVSDETIRIRALIAIILTLYTYRRRTAFYPEIERQLGLLAESPDFKRLLLTIILRFILARETEKISHKLQEEIIPEMMRLRPQINLGVSWSGKATSSRSGSKNITKCRKKELT